MTAPSRARRRASLLGARAGPSAPRRRRRRPSRAPGRGARALPAHAGLGATSTTGDTPTLDALLDGVGRRRAVGARRAAGDRRRPTATPPSSAGTRARGVLAERPGPRARRGLLRHAGGRGVRAQHRRRRRRLGAPRPSVPSPACSRNDRLDYGAEIGALGQALADARRAARRDRQRRRRWALLEGADLQPRRPASPSSTSAGVVPGGAVSAAAARGRPAAPVRGPLRRRPRSVAAFDEAWADGRRGARRGLRPGAGRPLPAASPRRGQRAQLRREALRAHRRAGRRPAGVGGPRARRRARGRRRTTPPGGSTSPSPACTPRASSPGCCARRAPGAPGFVTLVDIAPTILDLAGVDRPSSMEGRRFERTDDGAATGEERAAHLDDIDQAARYRDRHGRAGRDRLRRPAGRPLDRRRAGPRAAEHPASARVVALAALAMLVLPARPPTSPGSLDFHGAPAVAYWGFVVGLAVGARVLATALGGRRHASTRSCSASAPCSGSSWSTCSSARPLQLNTVFGYSPTVGGRFAGMGNLAYGQFAGRRVPALRAPRPGAWPAAASAPRWRSACCAGHRDRRHADLGLGRRRRARLRAGRRRDRRPAARPPGPVALGGGLGLGRRWSSSRCSRPLDLSRPADRRTHLGRLVEAVADQGVGALESRSSPASSAPTSP